MKGRVVIVCLLVCAWILLKWFSYKYQYNPLCHSSKVVGGIANTSIGVFSEDEENAYVAFNTIYYRKPIGICVLPDGGIPRYVHHSMDFAEIDILTYEIKYLSGVPGYHSSAIGLGSHIIGGGTHKGNSYYFSASGQAEDLSSHRLYFELDVGSGESVEISKQEYDSVKEKVSRLRGSYDVNSSGQYVKRGFVLCDSQDNEKRLVTNLDWLPYNFK